MSVTAEWRRCHDYDGMGARGMDSSLATQARELRQGDPNFLYVPDPRDLQRPRPIKIRDGHEWFYDGKDYVLTLIAGVLNPAIGVVYFAGRGLYGLTEPWRQQREARRLGLRTLPPSRRVNPT